MTLLILSEGLSSFEMWGNHSEECMCVNEYLSVLVPSWMEFPLQKLYKSQKSCLDCSNNQILQITSLGGTIQTPWMSRETPYVFSCRIQETNQQNQLCSDPRYFASYKKKSVRFPMAVDPWEKLGGKGKGPLGMEGPDEIYNQPHEYT